MKEIKFWIFVLVFCVGIGLGVWFSASYVYEGIEKDKESSYSGKLSSQVVSYEVGEKVVVELSNSIEKEFYVLDSDDKFVTLIAKDAIGETQFNVYTNGNNFNGSVVENYLQKNTSSWTNAGVVRLVTVEELRNTGLLEEKVECRGIEQCSDYKFEQVQEGSWLFTSYSYWTSTKYVDSEDMENRGYVYVVAGDNNEISQSIVGYPEGSEWGYVTYQVRPVIEISRDYVK